jgi:hypothetical protein
MFEQQGLLIEEKNITEQNLYDTARDIYVSVRACEADCMSINRSLFRVPLGTIHTPMECILSV